MVDQVRVAKADLRKPESKKPAPASPAPRKTFTMQRLWRLAVWGAMAATALSIAVMTTHGEVGARRTATVLSSLKGGMPPQPQPLPAQASMQPASRSIDAQADTRRLLEAVRGLAADNDQLKSRLATLEHSMEDVTGSISRQIQASKAASAQPHQQVWPDSVTPPTPATVAAELWPVMSPRLQYGVDIGSALSITTMRARWEGLRSAHPQLFGGLLPVVTLKAVPGSNRAELRLVIGPFASIDAATRLCVALVPYKLFCQPTAFTGQHLALE